MTIASTVGIVLLALTVLFLVVARIRAYVGLKKAGKDWEESQRELEQSIDELSNVFQSVERESAALRLRLNRSRLRGSTHRVTSSAMTLCPQCSRERRRRPIVGHSSGIAQGANLQLIGNYYLQERFRFGDSIRDQLAHVRMHQFEDASLTIDGSYADPRVFSMSEWWNDGTHGHVMTGAHSERQYQLAA